MPVTPLRTPVSPCLSPNHRPALCHIFPIPQRPRFARTAGFGSLRTARSASVAFATGIPADAQNADMPGCPQNPSPMRWTALKFCYPTQNIPCFDPSQKRQRTPGCNGMGGRRDQTLSCYLVLIRFISARLIHRVILHDVDSRREEQHHRDDKRQSASAISRTAAGLVSEEPQECAIALLYTGHVCLKAEQDLEGETVADAWRCCRGERRAGTGRGCGRSGWRWEHKSGREASCDAVLLPRG